VENLKNLKDLQRNIIKDMEVFKDLKDLQRNIIKDMEENIKKDMEQEF